MLNDIFNKLTLLRKCENFGVQNNKTDGAFTWQKMLK